MKKLIALILCAALLLSLAACTKRPTESTGESTVDSNEALAKDMYSQASSALDSVSDVTLNLLITTHTTVNGDVFSEESDQTLIYEARGTDDAVIVMEEALRFGVHDSEGDEKDEAVEYTETWYQGNVYAELDKTHRYRSPLDANAAAVRYTPVVLLNAELYGSITSEPADNGTRICFAEPTAAESWAVPQEGKLLEASGTALVTANGDLTEMNYTVTYTCGPSLVTMTVQSELFDTPRVATTPADPDTYASISSVDALRLNVSTVSNLVQADSITLSSIESLTCEAAVLTRNESIQANLHGRKENTQLKLETSVYFMNYTTMKSEEYSQEEKFLDGKLTTVVNDGLPSTDSSVTWGDVRAYMEELLTAGMLSMDYWKDITVTDLGTIYFLEYQLNDNFGNTMQNYICNMLWENPSYLMNLASKYENIEVNGYLSMDKYTGLPVATGYYYKGVHTIDGQNYAMILQYDQSIEAPSKGAYQEITDKRPAEEEPENKPTPLFYQVTGKDGQKMWLFGTVHVGDERTAYLPEEIRSAFAESDALALECNTELFDEQLEEDEKLSDQVSDLYFVSNEADSIKNLLSEEEFADAYKLLKAVGGNNQNMLYAKPFLWSDTIDQFYLRQGYQFHSDQGVEARLMDWAEEMDKDILEIESTLGQLQMYSGFSNKLQLLMLAESVTSDSREYGKDLTDLYEKWCAGDEAALREELSNEWESAELTEEELAEYKPLMEEYDKAMHHDRNAHMLDKAIDYLESGKTVFYAVGLAHLLNESSGLIDALQKAGYSVEQVTFKN